MRRIVLLATLAGLLVVTPAGAASVASIQAILNADGSGQMLVNSPTNPSGETWTWEVCAGDGTGCVAFGTGRQIGSGAAGSGSGSGSGVVFKATSSEGSVGTSPLWQGIPSAVTAPAASGAIRANELVTPVVASWTGGWAGDFSRTQLAACVNADGSDCTTLTDMFFLGGCANGAAVIDPAFTGRYLRVADQRFGVNSVFPAIASGSPYGQIVWPAGPATAVAVVGRIAAAAGPPAAACGVPLPGGTPPPPPPPPPSGPRPTAPRPPATVKLTKHGAAVVRCAPSCSVTLRATRGRVHARLTRTVKGPRTGILRLTPRKLKPLGAGKVTFTVVVDGVRRATRTVRVGKRTAR